MPLSLLCFVHMMPLDVQHNCKRLCLIQLASVFYPVALRVLALSRYPPTLSRKQL